LAGFEPENLGTKGQLATPRPQKPLILQFLVKEVNGSIINALDNLQQRKEEGLLKCKHGDMFQHFCHHLMINSLYINMEGLREESCKHLLFL
jgi:hypothetical protein